MFGTKSRSRKEPVTKDTKKPALLIVAHGERGGAGDDRLAHAVANRLTRSARYRSVEVCFVSKQPLLRQVFSEVSHGDVIIYPLFMSKGYFVREEIPEMLDADATSCQRKADEVKILEPVGLSPSLPKIVAELAISTAEASSLPKEAFSLLLVAHGSKHDGASREAALKLVTALRHVGIFVGVEPAFLEEEPFLEQQLMNIDGPTIAVGIFAGEGMHGGVDLPNAVKASGRTDILVSLPLARWPNLIEMICSDLE